MDMVYKQAVLDGKSMDVYNIESYSRVVENYSYNPGNVALEHNGYALPLRSPTDDKPGFVDLGPMVKYNMPQTQEQQREYSSDHIVDFSNIESTSKLLEAQQKIASSESYMLCNAENVFSAIIRPDDSPEIAGLKEATNLKNIDLDSYSHRFGDNYPNDKRIFKKKKATLNMITRIGENLDMDVYLCFADKSKDVPNPMGREVRVCLTSSERDCDSIESNENIIDLAEDEYEETEYGI